MTKRHHNVSNILQQKLAYVLPSIVSMPFYRERYGIGNMDEQEAMQHILDNFYQLPLLTREDAPRLTECFKDDGRGSRLGLTGGTCGISNVIEWCDEDVHASVAGMNELLTALGIRQGDRVFSTIPISMSSYGVSVELICQDLGLTFIPNGRISSGNMKIAEILIGKYTPKLMATTTVALLSLLEIPEMKKALQCVNVVVVGGAMTSQTDMEKIEREIGCRVINLIGSSEVCYIGLQRSCCDGFHVQETILMEIADADDNGVGKCVVTSLCNKRMPFVRYIDGDTGYLKKRCSCGYSGDTFVMTGRIADTCYLGGTKVDSCCFEHLTKSLGCNTMFQAFVYKNETPQRIRLNIVDDPHVWTMAQVLDDLLETNVALKEKLSMGIVKLEVDFINENELVGLNALGKWRRVLEQE